MDEENKWLRWAEAPSYWIMEGPRKTKNNASEMRSWERADLLTKQSFKKKTCSRAACPSTQSDLFLIDFFFCHLCAQTKKMLRNLPFSHSFSKKRFLISKNFSHHIEQHRHQRPHHEKYQSRRPDTQLVSKYYEFFRVNKIFYVSIDIHKSLREVITV